MAEIAATPGAKVTAMLMYRGVIVQEHEIDEHGYCGHEYLSSFNAAIAARDRAIKSSSIDDVFTMIAEGQNSIEAFVNLNAKVYNHYVPDNAININARNVPLDKKLLDWLPKIIGRPIDLSTEPAWPAFIKLRDIRNKRAHGDGNCGLNSLVHAAEAINNFRDAFASLLHTLHILVQQHIPASIIRATFFPNVVARVPSKSAG